MQTYCRVAPSLGALEGTPEEVWGTKPYNKNYNEPTVFFGLYDLRDYLALKRHKGKAWILWAGSDIRNLQSGFILNDGKLKTISGIIGNKWVFKILEKAEHWVENTTEQQALKELGIESQVCPSYMGNVNIPISFKPSDKTDVYVSASEGRQEEYGFGVVERIADWTDVTFHLYGATWKTDKKNIVVHGRIPKEEMNKQIRKMHCGLRLNEFDGFSEVTAKSILMGQYPISKVPNKYIPSFENDMDLVLKLNQIKRFKSPNQISEYYRQIINKYPFNVKDN